MKKIIRIVVNGSPSKDIPDNTENAKNILLKAFESNPLSASLAMFAITPGGFIRVPFPSEYNGKSGWNTCKNDFKKIIPVAQCAINKVLTEKVLKVARTHAKFLTLGVDLCGSYEKLQPNGPLPELHAEIIGVVDTATGEVVRCTGKSYPVHEQEKTLVHELDLQSHLFCCKGERVLILGCHDLNMFSNRGYAAQNPTGLRRKRCDDMRKLAKEFKPTIILQHPHSTDSQYIWSASWGSVHKLLQNKHIYASGIAYYHYDLESDQRQPLCNVLAGTRCCDKHVLDVVV